MTIQLTKEEKDKFKQLAVKKIGELSLNSDKRIHKDYDERKFLQKKLQWFFNTIIIDEFYIFNDNELKFIRGVIKGK